MGKFTGTVYDPPSAEFPHLAVMFDMTKTLVALPVSSVEHGKTVLRELAEGFVELAEKSRRA